MYHKVDNTISKPQISKEEFIQNHIPNNDFILILGTSHSRGCCEKNNREVTHIDDEYIWANIVAKELGYSCLNLSIPGNTNKVMVQQAIDFLELPHAKERCKLVICESRYGDIAGKFYHDLFESDYHEQHIPRREFITAGVGKSHWLDSIQSNFVPFKQKDNHVEELLRSSIHEFRENDYVPTPAIQKLNNMIDNFVENTLCSTEVVVNDMLDIRIMRSLFTMANIPFKFFFWDRNKVSEESRYWYKIQYLLNSMYNFYDNSIKSLEPNVNISGPTGMGKDIWHTTECDCGHRDHIVHEWVAKQIVEELKDDFRS